DSYLIQAIAGCWPPIASSTSSGKNERPFDPLANITNPSFCRGYAMKYAFASPLSPQCQNESPSAVVCNPTPKPHGIVDESLSAGRTVVFDPPSSTLICGVNILFAVSGFNPLPLITAAMKRA